MKKFLIIPALALSLAGCATFNADVAKLQQVFTIATTKTVPDNVAQVTVSSFEVLEAGSTEYFKYCKANPSVGPCAPGTVANPGPLRLVIKYIRQGRAARDQIKSAARTGQLISSTVYNLLVTAVNNLSATPAASFGAQK